MTKHYSLILFLFSFSFVESDIVDITIFKHNQPQYLEQHTLGDYEPIIASKHFSLDKYDLPLAYSNFSPIELLQHNLDNVHRIPFPIISHTQWRPHADQRTWSFSANNTTIQIYHTPRDKNHDIKLTLQHYDDEKNLFQLTGKQRLINGQIGYFDHHMIGALIQFIPEETNDNANLS
ncbi:MAG: hypothetical protein ACON5A_04410 [Candidatus Comchoanobacterales bacterium]